MIQMLSFRKLVRFALLICAGVGLVHRPASADVEKPSEPLSMFISVGDNLWLGSWLPIDSPTAVNSVFKTFREQFKCDRLIWRGSEEIWLENFLFRPESIEQYDYWMNWVKPRVAGGEISRAAVSAAHQQGMSIWLLAGLMDYGTQAAVGGCGDLPYGHEYKLRSEHREFAPIDRYGMRVQPGTVEFAYPQVRKDLVRIYSEFLSRYSYDGLWLYSYIENFGFRFDDEFGFNEPIVQEFKKRYGVDIRTQDFDCKAWAALRGEYVTQFLRELKAEIGKQHRKLGLVLDAEIPDRPQRWLATPATNGVGEVQIDWRTLVKEGIVDELMIYCGGDQTKSIESVLAATAGTNCKVSVFQTAPFNPGQQKQFQPRGVGRVAFGSTDDALWQRPADDAAAVTAQATQAKTSSNTAATGPSADAELANAPADYSRLLLLHEVTEKKRTASLDTLASLAKDNDVLTRREALHAATSAHGENAAPLLIAALGDAESGVRCTAVSCLSELKYAKAIAPLLDSLSQHDAFNEALLTSDALAAMADGVTVSEIAKGLTSPKPRVRHTTAYALARSGKVEASPYLLQALNDPDAMVRYRAAAGFEKIGGDAAVRTALLNAIKDDRDLAVQSRAVLTLASLCVNPTAAMRDDVLDALKKRFAEYGQDSKRPDADWGYRVIGNSLTQLGDQGVVFLNQCVTQKEDGVLAWRAWQILHQPQESRSYCTTTAAEDAKLHEEMPAHVRRAALRTKS